MYRYAEGLRARLQGRRIDRWSGQNQETTFRGNSDQTMVEVVDGGPEG